MKRLLGWLAAVLAVQALSSGLASAQDTRCNSLSGVPVGAALGVARVGGRARLHFAMPPGQGRADCPGPSPACRAAAYLMPGDVVLTLPGPFKGYVCGWFVNGKGIATSGWLASAPLQPVTLRPEDEAGWIGTWKRIEASIRIARGKDGALAAEGEATFGAFDKARVARGAVNMGDFSGRLRRTGDAAFVADDDVASFEAAPKESCAVRMRRAGPYLLVEDNRACGGMNVSFSGLYVRK